MGYGDVVLPGLLILFLREFDTRRAHAMGRTGEPEARLSYFACGMVAYAAGTAGGFERPG